MSNTKHTPGPWIVSVGLTGKLEIETATPVRFNTITAGTPIICDVWRHEDAEDFSGLANARLIAAAPDLLKALRGMLALDAESLRGYDDEDVSYEVRAARAAIAKAEGETK